MKELINLLREGVADTGVLIKTAANVNATMYRAADVLEQQAKQIEELQTKLKYAGMAANAEAAELDRANARIEELAAALAVKDEALDDCTNSLGNYKLLQRRTNDPIGAQVTQREILALKEALSLQPRAALVAKIKADAVRGAVSHFEELGFTGWATTELLSYADRIEKGEVE